MKLRTILTAFIAICLFLPIDSFAQTNDNWKTYDIYSMKLSLPAYFSMGTKNEFNTYSFSNSISNSISLNIECLIASPTFTPGSLSSYHDDCTAAFSVITYDVTKADFFELSGIDKAGNILYIKGVKKEGSYFGLSLSYNKKYQYLIDKNLSKISSSFK